ncbi:unnamed protein product, partial [Prorocentrum cordatum]
VEEALGAPEAAASAAPEAQRLPVGDGDGLLLPAAESDDGEAQEGRTAPLFAPRALKPKIPKPLRGLVGKAIADYSMIKEGDRVLVGLSGGKDSLTVLHVLLGLQKSAPVRFDVAAANVNPETPEYNPGPLTAYLEAIAGADDVAQQLPPDEWADELPVALRVPATGGTGRGGCKDKNSAKEGACKDNFTVSPSWSSARSPSSRESRLPVCAMPHDREQIVRMCESLQVTASAANLRDEARRGEAGHNEALCDEALRDRALPDELLCNEAHSPMKRRLAKHTPAEHATVRKHAFAKHAAIEHAAV